MDRPDSPILFGVEKPFLVCCRTGERLASLQPALGVVSHPLLKAFARYIPSARKLCMC